MRDLSTARCILCAVDLSDSSERALRYAIDLTVQLGARLDVVHVYQPMAHALVDVPIVDADEYLDDVDRAVYAELDEHLRRATVGRSAPSPPIERLVVRGQHPAHEIARIALERDADLIVLGTHSRSALGHLLHGVAERVVRASPCPVLTVPAGPRWAARERAA